MYDTILFDLDGTLTDPKEGITKSVQYALSCMGIKEDNADSLTSFIGPPLIESFKSFYNMDDRDSRFAVDSYRERFASVGMYENTVYPGIPEMLQELRRGARTLAVATSKPTVFATAILDHFGLRDYFSFVFGGNLDGTRSEKAEVIASALCGVAAGTGSTVVMVGDRMYDVIGAKNNGIDAIAVEYGYGGHSELVAAEPDYIVATVAELSRLLRD